MAITILIVDDSKLARIVVRKALAELQPHWKIVEADNAHDALTVARARRIDVTLLDYSMPDTNGLVLASELRALHPEMPIAIVTANIQQDVVLGARSLNATHIRKPVMPGTLERFIADAAARLLEPAPASL